MEILRREGEKERGKDGRGERGERREGWRGERARMLLETPP